MFSEYFLRNWKQKHIKQRVSECLPAFLSETELQAEVEGALISFNKPYPVNTSSSRGILDGSSDLEKISKLVKLTLVRYVCKIKRLSILPFYCLLSSTNKHIHKNRIWFCAVENDEYIEESDVQVNDPENEDEESNYDDNVDEEPI